jgi:hypothetical protein
VKCETAPKGRPEIVATKRNHKQFTTLLRAEVTTRLEAIAANSANAILGELPATDVLVANVGLADRAALFLRVALEEAA